MGMSIQVESLGALKLSVSVSYRRVFGESSPPRDVCNHWFFALSAGLISLALTGFACSVILTGRVRRGKFRMNRCFEVRVLAVAGVTLAWSAAPAWADGLKVVYPPSGHTTTAERVFFIGTANRGDAVWLNGRAVHRSPAGHFAPSMPLALGTNEFHFVHKGQSLRMSVVRKPLEAAQPSGAAFAPGSLEPAQERLVQQGEPVRFSAVAAPGAVVTVHVGGRTIPLMPQPVSALLPDNKAG